MNMNTDEIRAEILTAAILGTDRHPIDLPMIVGKLSQAIKKLNPANAQDYLLSINALVGTYTQIGKQPVHAPEILDTPCPIDDLNRCSPIAALLLQSMLSGQNKEIIPEWISLAMDHSHRVPEEILPDLLQYAEKNPDAIEIVLQVIGKRGRWLALRIPGMEKTKAAVAVESLTDDKIENFWQTEKLYARNLLLQTVRKSNPAKGLALISLTWNEDHAEERKTFLSTLSTNLSMEDEPFLENALDDRSGEVRQAAVELLSRLPQSRLVQRQIARIEPLINWKPGSLLRKAELNFSFPDKITKEMARDGLQKQSINRNWGEKATYLYQILRCIPPKYWNENFQKKPQDLLEIALSSELKTVLIDCWTTAAIFNQDAEWAKAIQLISPWKKNLIQFMPESEQRAFIFQQLKTDHKVGIQMLTLFKGPWGKDITQIALAHLQEFIPTTPNRTNSFVIERYHLANMTHYMEPFTAIDIFTKFASKADPTSEWSKRIDTSLQLLDFRKRMMEEFN
jgi:hypothetical protein